MRTPYGAWRATYTPGSWIVLSGPSSMVVMQPAGADSSGLVNQIWDQLLASASITEITARLTGFGLDAMPDLAVFFWDAGQLHCLLRGRVRVLDADTAELLASGEGAWTWHEAHLATGRVRVRLDDIDPDELLRLPLVIGAVGASSILLDARDAEPVPDVEPVPDAEPEAVSEVLPQAEPEREPDPKAEPEPEAASEALTQLKPEPEPEPEDQWDTDFEPIAEEPLVAVVPTAEPATQVLDVITSAPLAVPPTPPVARQTEQEPTKVLGGRPPYAVGQEPGAPAEEPEPASGLGMGGFGRGKYGTTGPWGPLGFAAALDAGAPEPVRPAFVPAAPAAFQPAQPPVPEPVAPPVPEPPVPKPVAPPAPPPDEAPACAILVTSAGRRPLVGPVVVGRAPAISGDDPEAEPLRVASPRHDISRTHLRIAPSGWQIEVTDLHSMNGTLAISPDGRSMRLEPGQPTQLGLGWTIDIGDGQTIVLEPPD